MGTKHFTPALFFLFPLPQALPQILGQAPGHLGIAEEHRTAAIAVGYRAGSVDGVVGAEGGIHTMVIDYLVIGVHKSFL